ncbi:efflux RND transporter periplasmic adaptor subunit [Brevibacillus laterosporus]|uniref:Transporter n=1 Tax=Brevibacillus laterosporus TaxID=1465 RepID=A0AAP8QGR7_BRELA|nr:efflux RND transporter periplasmic adaptor subunit [Brevibacillus laterosporus]MCR8980166.1 efflux RND transporter periplasmic adaptor subunit [Brevibacillus laterosporus]MCZ0807321.1 efflux RND transporter periplasmic adaptor subunit [Brevibacillus laterosporus]MCZ0825570.1 efflux RND transporter periplasmic adaptor subunit [Brevibacillus laterosporus]MCZ0849347.1 efflux RND transporter periplasmic adaptor subunit [Brevibacillus laterosporus]MED1664779.1 efflux RND transporter periplasmic 
MEVRPKKTRNFTIILTSILFLVILVILYYSYKNYYYISTDDAHVTGEIYKIAARVPGKIEQFNLEEGTRVSMNQVVSKLEQVNASNISSLENMVVRSPIDGIIIQKLANQGEIVGAGNPLALVMNKASLYIQANIEETKAGYVKAGQPVEIRLDMFPGHVYQGKVEYVGEATQSTFSLLPPTNAGGSFTKVTQRIPVKISFVEQAFNFRPGSNASVTILVR